MKRPHVVDDVFPYQVAQKLVNYQMDKVSVRQIKAKTGVSFHSLLNADVDPSEIKQYERKVDQWIIGVMDREGVPEKNRPSVRARLMEERKVADETMSRFAMGVRYAEQTGDLDPDAAINLAVGNGEHLVKHHPKMLKWLSSELRDFVVGKSLSREPSMRTASLSEREPSMHTATSEEEEEEGEDLQTVQHWLPGIAWGEKGTKRSFQADLVDSAVKVEERSAEERSSGLFEGEAVRKKSTPEDVWIPSIEVYPGKYFRDKTSRPLCYDMTVTTTYAPGARLANLHERIESEPGREVPARLAIEYKDIIVEVDRAMAYRELQFIDVLGKGSFGATCSVRDITLKGTIAGSHTAQATHSALSRLANEDDSYAPVHNVALKITTENRHMLDSTGKQSRTLYVEGGVGEYIIGQILNLMFLRAKNRGGPKPMAVTPNVTESLFGFVCHKLPPSKGKWSKLYDMNSDRHDKRQWNRIERTVSGIPRNSLVVINNFMELSTEGDLWAAEEAFGELLVDPTYMKSFLFQGLFTLAAFEEHGFLHQDIKPGNIGVTAVPDNAFQIYYVDSSRGIPGSPDFVSYDPTREMFSSTGSNARMMLKFIDYGNYSMTNFTFVEEVGKGESKTRHEHKAIETRDLRGTVTYTAPECFIMPRFEGRRAGDFTEFSKSTYVAAPVFSTASDVWAFAVSLVAIIIGENPVHLVSDEPWPRAQAQLWESLKKVSRLPSLRNKKMWSLARYWRRFRGAYGAFGVPRTDVGAFTMLFSVVEMIGYPWSKPNMPEEEDPDLMDYYVHSGNFPVAEVLYSHVQAYPNTFEFANTGGWLKHEPRMKYSFGANDRSVRDATGLNILAKMLSWRPQDRSDPHGLLTMGIGVDPFRGYWNQMLIPDTEVEALESNEALLVKRYGWAKASLTYDTVRMVGGHMSADHTRHLEKMQFVGIDPLGDAPSSRRDSGGKTDQSAARAETRLPTWKISRLPREIAESIDAHPQLSRLFGKIDDKDRVETRPPQLSLEVGTVADNSSAKARARPPATVEPKRSTVRRWL